MRLKKYINELWVVGKIEVIEIPPMSMRDMKAKVVRFTIINKNKMIYVWDAKKAIHDTIWYHIRSDKQTYMPDDPNTSILNGIAKKIKGRWTMVESDQYTRYGDLDYMELSKSELKKYNKAFKWVDNNINISNFFDNYISVKQKLDLDRKVKDEEYAKNGLKDIIDKQIRKGQ